MENLCGPGEKACTGAADRQVMAADDAHLGGIMEGTEQHETDTNAQNDYSAGGLNAPRLVLRRVVVPMLSVLLGIPRGDVRVYPPRRTDKPFPHTLANIISFVCTYDADPHTALRVDELVRLPVAPWCRKFISIAPLSSTITLPVHFLQSHTNAAPSPIKRAHLHRFAVHGSCSFPEPSCLVAIAEALSFVCCSAFLCRHREV